MSKALPEAQSGKEYVAALRALKEEVAERTETVDGMAKSLAATVNARIAYEERLQRSDPISWKTHNAPMVDLKNRKRDIPREVIDQAVRYFRKDIQENYDIASWTQHEKNTIIIRLTFTLKPKSPYSKAE